MKHTRTLGLLVLLMGFTLSVVGCAVSEKTPENEPTPMPAPMVVVTRMTALRTEPLTMVDSCLRIGDSEASNLVVWPPDFEVSIENDTIWVLYDDHEVEVQLGQVVRLGGGEVKSLEAFDERTRQGVPADCPGPYWLVGSISPGEETERPEAPADLDGAEWVLTSLNGESLIEDTEITLYFEEALLGGSMTCNGYGGGRDSGKYIATDDGSLTIPMIAVTLQLCSEPKGLMEQEAAYIEALQDAASYRVTGDRLEIANAAGETTLVFAREADAAVQAPDDIRAARDSALAYVSKHHGEQAPPPGLTWTAEDATPEGLIGGVTYQFRAEDWVVAIGHAVVPPEMRVYQVSVSNPTTGFWWEGRIDAEEFATEGTEIVLTARDAGLSYISEHYGEQAPPSDLAWEGGRATPEGLVGGETFQYTADDWVVTITYPVVAPENVVYHIVVANPSTGFQWEGELDAERYLTETAAPEASVPQVMLDRIGARDAALSYIFEQYQYPPVESLAWEEELVTSEGLVGAETYRYTAFDWVAEISYNVVAPAAMIYQVKVTNPTLGLNWQGEVDAVGQVTETGGVPTGGDFQPLSPAACSDLANAMAQTLGVEVAMMAETPFQDYISRETGSGCQATATGTGLDFEDFWSVAEDLKEMLNAQGWQEDISYMAGGPTGAGSGFRKDNGLCLLLAGWEPSEDADCPTDKPIGLCELSTEQQLYTITLNCAQDS